MHEASRRQKAFKITGRVQGVFFRVWTQQLARELGLTGTVRNVRDGSVEAHVSGSPQAIQAFRERLWMGPPAALVEDVVERGSAAILPEDDFQILPSV